MQFKNKEVEKEYLERIENLKKVINSPVVDTQYLWNETVRKYAVTMEQVRKMLQINEIKPSVSERILSNIQIFLDKCSNPEFHIALVGAIKAGKSTLINALLGYELASTEVTPETAALTKFKSANEDYVEVSFYSKEEWDKLWKSVNEAKAEVFLEEYQTLNADAEKKNWLGKSTQRFTCADRVALKEEIRKWTSSKSPTHYFVKEVIIGLKDFDLPEGVVLVDTPGLDDVVEYRSDITRKYIDRANAVLMCVRSDALTGQELQTILRVFINARNNVEKVYIIATQIDTLNRPKTDWEKQSAEWIKYLKGRNCYRDAQMAARKLVPVSAYLYTILHEYNDKEFGTDDDKYFDLTSILLKLRIKENELDDRYKEIEDFTNIRLLKSKLQDEIISNFKKYMVEDIVAAYKDYSAEIREKIDLAKKEQQELINTSQQDIDEIKRKKEEYQEKLNSAIKEKEDFSKMIRQIKYATTQRADELIRNIRGIKNV